MFTGIIEGVGTLAELKSSDAGYRLRIATTLAGALRPGDSLAVNGVCLTVILTDGREVYADVGPETARVTTFGTMQRGKQLNLERPLQLDSRLGGHLVQGHVDAVGAIDEMRAEADSHWMTVSFPASLAPFFIRKGSVAVDGVSLAVAGLDERKFDIQIIPYTWQHTALNALRAQDRVNLECDMIGKYVVRALELQDSAWGADKRWQRS